MDVAERYGHFQWSLDYVGLVLAETSASDDAALLPHACFAVRTPLYVSPIGYINKIKQILRHADCFQTLVT